MTDEKKYERLTEKDWKVWFDEELYTSACEPTDIELHELYGSLAELEDKIENGTLIELPCKVGDKLYSIPFDNSKIFEHKVKGFRIIAISENKQSNYIVTDIGFLFGKNAFLTKAEAEKKLKELQND